MRKSPGDGAFSLPRGMASVAAGLLVLSLAACARAPAPVSHCWVQLFARPEFDPRGLHDIVFGPGAWPTLDGLPRPGTRNWEGKVASLITGPQGRLLVWSLPGFAGTPVEVAPSRTILHADRCLPPVRSMVLECR